MPVIVDGILFASSGIFGCVRGESFFWIFLKLRLLEKLKLLTPTSRGLSFFAANIFRTVLLIGYNQKSVF